MFCNIYKNKKILITGHTGFKGSWLTIWLNLLGAKIYGISDNYPTSPSFLKTVQSKIKINNFLFDIRDSKKVNDCINKIKPDFIFHLAAKSLVHRSYVKPLETIETNIMGTSNILNSLKNYKRKCNVVLITSDKSYKNNEWLWGYRENDAIGGEDPYSVSKSCCEFIIDSYYKSYFSKKNCKIKIAVARAGNVIGGGDWSQDRIVPDIIINWRKKNPVVVNNPNSTRPWQHVLEPLSGYLLLGLKLYKNEISSGEAYNFGPDEAKHIPVIEVVNNFKKILKFKKITIKKNKNKKNETKLLKLNCDKSYFQLNGIFCFIIKNQKFMIFRLIKSMNISFLLKKKV